MKYAAIALLATAAAFALAPDAVTAGPGVSGAAPSSDGIGAVLSSFRMTGTSKPYAIGIYRDASYVYGLVHGSSQNYLYRFTAAGSRVATFVLSNTATPRDACSAHLGAGYLSFVDAGERHLYTVPLTGGSAVSSFPVAGSPFPLNCFWDGSYYNVNGAADLGVFNRYDETGAAGGTWSYLSWPEEMTYCAGAAYAEKGNNGDGPYVVACSWLPGEPMCMATAAIGSVVRTWIPPGENGNGLAYGKASLPAVYGNAVWAAWFAGSGIYAYEFDIVARHKPAVEPTSLGKIKSLYR